MTDHCQQTAVHYRGPSKWGHAQTVLVGDERARFLSTLGLVFAIAAVPLYLTE